MKNRKSLLYKLLAVSFLIIICIIMMIIGRGHTIYLDNKTKNINGQNYSSFYKAVIIVNGKEVARLGDGDRGEAISIGQNFNMTIKITPNKNDKETISNCSIPIPYNKDQVILNLPTLLSGLKEQDYMEEFIPLTVVENKEEDIEINEFEMPLG